VTTAARATIAVIDDDCRVRESLDDLLDCAGFRVRLFASSGEFLHSSALCEVDCVISDIAMPEMDGLQLIRTLRQKKGLEGIPAIALTGYASEKDAETAIAAGFNTHLAKPIEPARLSAAVERLLNSCQSR